MSGSDYLDLPKRPLAEVLRERCGVDIGTRVVHDELGAGAIAHLAPDGRYAAVDFDRGMRFTVHLLDLTIELQRGNPA
jgi:hypothetical protein